MVEENGAGRDIEVKKGWVGTQSSFAGYLLVPVAFGFFLIFGDFIIPGNMLKAEQELVRKKHELEVKLHKTPLRVGIQGGRGSFNELALQTHMLLTPEQKYEIKYLHTTDNVLSALEKENIDLGQFAVRNTLGGEVTESAESMKKHKFEKIAEFNIKVVHNLMISPGATISDIDTVVAHPQALKQCKEHLTVKYPKLKQLSGEGDLIDPSTWAEKLGRGEIGKNYAILGNKTLASLNKLKIIEENMQDSDKNFTTFVWVERQSN